MRSQGVRRAKADPVEGEGQAHLGVKSQEIVVNHLQLAVVGRLRVTSTRLAVEPAFGNCRLSLGRGSATDDRLGFLRQNRWQGAFRRDSTRGKTMSLTTLMVNNGSPASLIEGPPPSARASPPAPTVARVSRSTQASPRRRAEPAWAPRAEARRRFCSRPSDFNALACES